MRRFLLDALCILLIVILGRTYLSEQEPETVNDKLERFNTQVENQEIIAVPDNTMPLNQIEENFAGQLGNSISTFFVEFIDGSVRLVTTVFSVNDQ